MMIYALLILISAIMAVATFCAIAKPGEAENIAKYGQEDSDK